jgi:hypothetical protein
MSISKEATLISTNFADLRDIEDAEGEKAFLVYNFNSPRRLTKGQAKLCDHIIMSKKTGLHFIEVKLDSTKDKMSIGQKLFAKIISYISEQNEGVHYWIIHNLDEAYAVFDYILHGYNEITGGNNGTTE